MRARQEVVLHLMFGPAATPTLPAAVAFAAEHAEDLQEVGGGRWWAVFRLGSDEATHGRALQLLHMVFGWRTTLVEPPGPPSSPEGPLHPDEFPVPSQERARGDDERTPPVPGKDPARRSQQHPIEAPQPRAAGLPAKDPDLMAQDEDLEVLRAIVRASAGGESGEGTDHQPEKE